jgi:hypothetical protein
MIKISLELARIAGLFNVKYLRASSISDSNMLTHYEEIAGGAIIYTGFGDPKYTFEGATPVETVPVEVFCLYRNQTKDNTATQTDILLSSAERLAADIIYNFKTAYNDILEYNLAYVTINDSLLTGYRLTFEADLEGLNCQNPPFVGGTFNAIVDAVTVGQITLTGCTNSLNFAVGDLINIASEDGLYNLQAREIKSIVLNRISISEAFIGESGAGTYSKNI